jgi:hypothetical protein
LELGGLFVVNDVCVISCIAMSGGILAGAVGFILIYMIIIINYNLIVCTPWARVLDTPLNMIAVCLNV